MTSILKRVATTFGMLLLAISMIAIPSSSSANILGNNNFDDSAVLEVLSNGKLGQDLNIDSDLSRLIILDSLFDDSVFGRPNKLGDLFVLDKLFNDNSSGNPSNLGNLIILNELFN